jgi:glycine reductase
MSEVIPKICALGQKIVAGQLIGSSREEGYLPRGIRRNKFHMKQGCSRALEMLLRKIGGELYSTEIPLPQYDAVDPAPPIQDLGQAKIALVTESGLVPKGNPDGLESARATKWLKYNVRGQKCLSEIDYYSVHGGFDVADINKDPCRVLPVDAVRILEGDRKFEKLHDYFYVTTGNATAISNATRFGYEIAQELLREQVNGVIFTAT